MYGKFLVEGEKTVNELLNADWAVDKIIATQHYSPPSAFAGELIYTTENELKQIATQQQPDKVIAIATIPLRSNIEIENNQLYLIGDTINDPGNLGTMIRIANWFGISAVFLSKDSVDAYNPKVVSAAKGALFKVKIYYTDIEKLLKDNHTMPIYGTFMNGENIYSTPLSANGFIVMGNEANGISAAVAAAITTKIAIPSFGDAESLNVAVATGIILSEFKRR